MADFDLIIKSAQIVDGSGKPAFRGDIAINGDKIAGVGVVPGEAGRIFDGSGLVATPGFIDAHSHADLMLQWYPSCDSYVMQGVTTWVGGQCGQSQAPLNEWMKPIQLLEDYIDEYVPNMYGQPQLYPVSEMDQWLKEQYGFNITWRTMGEFFDVVEEMGFNTNYVPLVGHAAIRAAVMGKDYKRHSTKDEQQQIRKHIHQAMEAGCFGMSSGMDYQPDAFANSEEIINGVKVLKEYDGIYTSHWRRTGVREAFKAGHQQENRMAGILEVIDTCRTSGVRSHISHLFGGYDIYPKPTAELQKAIGVSTLSVIDEALADGLPLTFDVIPYQQWQGIGYLSCIFFNPWVKLMGSKENFARWLKAEDFRKEITTAFNSGKWYIREHISPNINPNWSDNVTVTQHQNSSYQNRTLTSISKSKNQDPFEMLLMLIANDPEVRGGFPDMRGSEYIIQFFQHAASMVGCDIDIYDLDRKRPSPPYNVPSMLTYSGFPGFLNFMVKEKKALTLESAIRKCTHQTAQAHQIKNRGLIKEGYYADIVVMDFENLCVKSTVKEPRQYPQGIHHVIVNGKSVVEENKIIDTKPGRVIRRQN